MKRLILILLSSTLLCAPAFSQKKPAAKDGYKFETVVRCPITQVKDQALSGTCWCFSGISFIESEILRSTGEECDLSEMFVVSNAYYDRALKYVRLHGNLNFGPGSSFSDVLAVLETCGIVPESAMPGLNYGTGKHAHFEMDEILKAIVSAVVKNPNTRLTPAWKMGFKAMVAAYLGEVPASFTVDGKEFTPKSYMASLGIQLSDYVDISSWTHHPFYEKMVIEVPDNWRARYAYNVPLDDMIAIIDNALDLGYTVAWASDVTEPGFMEDGIAVVPETEVTQEMRQAAFDDYSTTDDHGMHIFGKATDQNGAEYYMVKNSWGKSGPYEGIWYVSKAYVRYKTTDIVVNKNAIPSGIASKLQL